MGKLVLAAYRTLGALLGSPGREWEGVGPRLRLARRAVLVLAIVVPALIAVSSTFRVIPAGHVGVATLLGRAQARPLPEGLNIINPLLHLTLMSTQVQRRSAKYDAASKALQAVHVEMVLNYRLLQSFIDQAVSKEAGTITADTPIFWSTWGQARRGKVRHPMTGKNVWRLSKTYGRLIGYPQLKPHELRHGVAMEVYEQHGDLEQVRGLLGHARLDTTQG